MKAAGWGGPHTWGRGGRDKAKAPSPPQPQDSAGHVLRRVWKPRPRLWDADGTAEQSQPRQGPAPSPRGRSFPTSARARSAAGRPPAAPGPAGRSPAEMAPGWGRSHSLPRPEHRPCLRAPRAVHSWAEGASGRAGTAPGAAPSAGGGRGCGGTWARAPRNGPETPRVLPETPEGKPHPRHPAPPHRAAALVHARYPRAVPSARGHPRHGRAARAHTRAEPAPPPSLATCVPSAAPPRPRPQRRGSQRAEARGASRRGMDPPAKEGSLLVQHSHKFGTKVGGRPARPSRRAGPGRGGRGRARRRVGSAPQAGRQAGREAGGGGIPASGAAAGPGEWD